MKFLAPLTIADAMLISSTVAETDYAAWNAATAYTLGQRCIRTTATTHKIYERIVAGTTATAPESDTTNWVEIGPTNRWKMFDQSVGSVTSKATSIVVVLASGEVTDSLALLDVSASSVRVVMADGAAGPTVFDETYDMGDTATLIDWYDYFFAPIELQTELIVETLPPYSSGRITVTVTAPTTAEVGTMALGTMVELGSTRMGTGLGIIDYSRKETDAYGVTSVVERSYAKRMDVPVLVERTRMNFVTRSLAAARAVPCVWIASDLYSSLIIYGFYKDWSLNIPYPDYSEMNLTVEGLV